MAGISLSSSKAYLQNFATPENEGKTGSMLPAGWAFDQIDYAGVNMVYFPDQDASTPASTASAGTNDPTAAVTLNSATAYTQNFDMLVNTGTSATLPAGWAIAETGSAANTTYAAGTGSDTTGNTYSFGSTGSTDRALGGLQSGSLIPTFGAEFTNTSAQTMTSLLISYTGEQWRIGALGRADRLDFQISFNATSLTTGTWVDVDTLDFTAPVTTGTVGALNGNVAPNRTAISATIASLAGGAGIAAGQTFWIRWNDLNATGSDDGLAVDDFSLTPTFGGAAQPTLSISDATVTEGNSGTTLLTYTVTASTAAGAGGISFDIATAGTGTATAGTDFVAQSITGATIAAGQTSYTFSVVVNGDTGIEPNETVMVNLANATGATIADGQGVGTIVNDDYGLSISDATVSEGDAGTVILTYTVTASSAAPAGGITFDIATADGTATAGVDYVAQALTGQTIAAGQTSYTFSVVVNGDTVVEPNETVLVNLSNVIGAAVTDGQGVGTIVDNDFPTLSISDASVTEGNSGTTLLTYTVTSSAPALAGGISFTIATADGTATAGSDYVAQSTTGTIAAGQTSYTFSVVVNGDVTNEPSETVLVNLSNVTGASVADGQGVGTIINDDGPIRIFSENFANFLAAGFAPTPTASQLDSDIWRVAGLSDNLTPGYGATLTTGDFARGVINGAADPSTGGVYSPSADHALVVQPTAADFDAGGFIEAKVQNTSGKTAVAFDVGFDWAYRNSGGRADNMQLSYSTDGTNFTVVPAAAFVTPTVADTTVAATFTNQHEAVSLSGLAVADGGFIYLRWTHLDGAAGSGSRDEIGIDNVTIDATTSNLATATIANISVVEGDAGTTNATFTVVRSSGVGAASVDYTTANGTATAGSDYVAANGTVSFADGETSKTVTILVNGDTAFEAAETFFLNLSNASNVLLPSSQATATITNDDNGAIAIYDIQGAGHKSALAGQFVATSGIVTAVAANGFYLQDPTGDGNARTSDGIFVFTSTAPTVAVGDGISLTGTVIEFDAGDDTLTVTQITAPTITPLTQNNTLPAAVLIGATGGILPPTQSIDSDNFATFNPDVDGIDFYETLEGMRVTIQAPVAVSNTNNFGETFVVASGGTGATGFNSRGGITISAGDNNPERIQIDNDSTIFAGYTPSHTVGDRLGDVTGVFNYAFQSYELLVTQAVTVTSNTTPTRETSTLVGDATHVSFASFNIENADPTDPASKFTLIGNEIKFALNTPDIIALQEVQDADGAGNGTNYSGAATAQKVIDAIIAAGGPTYSYIEVAPTANNTTGGEPNGNIRNGFLYNAARVGYVNGSVALVPGVAYNNSRNPLVADFTFNGQTFTTVSVHSTSRGGSDAFYGDIQPPVQAGDSQRTAQADTLRAYINNQLATDPNHQYIIGGDFNGYYYETALQHLAAGGVLTNLYDLLPVQERYSYIFDGNEQAFDNILITGGLRNNAQFDVVHYNSEQLAANQATDHDQALALIEIPLPNVAPTAIADVVTTAENIIAVVNVLGNDTDPDGGPKNVASVNGASLTVGQSTTIASGAIVTLADDGTLRYNPNGVFNGLNDGATGSDSFSYALNGGSAATVSVTINGVTQTSGDSGNNTVTGTAGNDTYDFSQGGNDTVSTGGGNDAIFFGAAFNQNDVVDGGTGTNDQLGLQGDYTGGNALTLGAANLTGVEVVALLPGFDYNVTTLDDVLATGQTMTVFGGGLGAGDTFTFNGSAESSGTFLVYGGFGADTLTGGNGNDGFSFGAGKFNPTTDVINGGGGSDQVVLKGYTGTISGANLISIETVSLGSGSNNLTIADDWTLAGQAHTVFGAALMQSLIVDGSAETDGRLAIYGGSMNDTLTGGAGNDMIIGGAGADTIRGGLGADVLRGDAGADTFILGSAAESTSTAHDTLVGFDANADKIDLPTVITAIDPAITTGTLSNGSFDSDLTAALTGLGANHAITFTADQGDLAGHIFLVADTNGIAGYQAGQDAVFELLNPVGQIIDTTPFI